MTDVHARIQRFLQQQTIHPLYGENPIEVDSFYNKAGTLPYIEGKERRFLVMKPVPKHAHLQPPSYQLCKGTRMQHLATGWRDLADNEAHTGIPDTLAANALREAIEEVGLTLEGIIALYDCGPYPFASSKSTVTRHMWLFAAHIKNEDALLPMQEVAATTTERRWMTAAEFAVLGREDHRPILADIASRLED